MTLVAQGMGLEAPTTVVEAVTDIEAPSALGIQVQSSVSMAPTSASVGMTPTQPQVSVGAGSSVGVEAN